MRTRRWIVLALALVPAGAAAAAGAQAAAAVVASAAPAAATRSRAGAAIGTEVTGARADKIHGMTLSTPRGSAEWGRPTIGPTLSELAGLGVNWIAIHPYARIERDGTVRWRGLDGEPPDWLRRPIEEAHRLGLKILIKPHLAHWGNFSWRGEIAFEREDQWRRFFATYGEWVSSLARLAREADAFAVGTELDRTVMREEEWRRVIARVRAAFPGPLTYAANWSDYERVPFWGALDAIGIQAYFPLLRRGEADGALPSQRQLDEAWTALMDRLREYGRRHDRTIVFTELGYNRSAEAPYEPWDYRVGGEGAAQLQVRCMRAALAAIEREPAVVGAFLWKWFPGSALPRDFAMSTPAMRRVIREFWTRAAAPGRS